MDFFQHRYYNTNKILMSMIGLWSYQTTRRSLSIIFVLWVLESSVIVPIILFIVKHHGDFKFVLDCVPPLFLVSVNFLKIIFYKYNSREILQLLECIRRDWEVWADDEEINIFHKYAEQGRKITIAYTVTLSLGAVVYSIEPLMPQIIDFLLKNGSDVRTLPLPVDYYKLDVQKYYFYIIIHLNVCGFALLVLTVAADTMFIVYIQHSCAIFSALGHKLQRTGKNKKSAEIGKTMYVVNTNDGTYNHLVSCIDRHNDAIQYAELIEAAYSSYLFFLVGITMIGISVTAYQILDSLRCGEGFARYVAALLLNVLHIYMDSYFCQMIIDHSFSIGYYVHNSNWYTLPWKVQKLLCFVIMRSKIPCKLTAGKMSVMSVETFAAILKMSVSYFTLLRSV